MLVAGGVLDAKGMAVGNDVGVLTGEHAPNKNEQSMKPCNNFISYPSPRLLF